MLVIGGGAAGFMAAITAAEKDSCKVIILEFMPEPLKKVLISGGGRCNVTNACWEPGELVNNYPRGKNPLRGPFSRFATGDAVAWFSDHGLELFEELDGRMFPLSNRSSEVVDCLCNAAFTNGVKLRTGVLVQSLRALPEKGFEAFCKCGLRVKARCVLLATGSHSSGRRLATSLGHRVIPPVASLFTLTLESPELIQCSGVTLENVHLTLELEGKIYCQIGKVLITHRGLSGPAILRLTAFAALALKRSDYRGTLLVNWSADLNESSWIHEMSLLRRDSPRRLLLSTRPFADRLPRSLWQVLLLMLGIDPNLRWGNCTRHIERQIANKLYRSKYRIKGRGPFGEEFVTAGGVDLTEVNLATMESRLKPGLYFAGELLNVDGVTGGFNFQHCWTSGWLAGKAIGSKC